MNTVGMLVALGLTFAMGFLTNELLWLTLTHKFLSEEHRVWREIKNQAKRERSVK